MANIALVEDDIVLAQSIIEFLEMHGFTVSYFETGTSFLNDFDLTQIELIIVDLVIFDVDGFEILEYLKSIECKVPRIVISGMLDIDYLERAFRLGAKDYIKKPVNLKEILLRIERFANPIDKIVLSEEIIFYKQENKLFVKGKEVYLSPKLRSILQFFCNHPNEILTYNAISNNIWENSTVSNNTIATYIRDINRIIAPVKIANIPKTGYQLTI